MPGELFETLRQLSANNPFLKFMGMELLDAGEGWVKMKIAFRPEFLQPLTVHGGATYSLADSAAASEIRTSIAKPGSSTSARRWLTPRRQSPLRTGRWWPKARRR